MEPTIQEWRSHLKPTEAEEIPPVVIPCDLSSYRKCWIHRDFNVGPSPQFHYVGFDWTDTEIIVELDPEYPEDEDGIRQWLTDEIKRIKTKERV